MDRTAMLHVLRLSGLGFVANNLHARWETGSAHTQSHFVEAIETWLGINPDHNSLWAAVDSERRDSVQQNLPSQISFRMRGLQMLLQDGLPPPFHKPI
jgi:hypothetical protein